MDARVVRKVTMLNLVAMIVMRGHGAAGLSNLTGEKTGEKGRRGDGLICLLFRLVSA